MLSCMVDMVFENTMRLHLKLFNFQNYLIVI